MGYLRWRDNIAFGLHRDFARITVLQDILQSEHDERLNHCEIMKEKGNEACDYYSEQTYRLTYNDYFKDYNYVCCLFIQQNYNVTLIQVCSLFMLIILFDYS